jgi:glycosyltransferase involved in cell wall biosynthesis
MPPVFLTIAIPFYNGLDKISNILNLLYRESNVDYEILLINDFSTEDQTTGLLDLINFKFKNGNLRYIYNPTNLGMDANFEKCIFNSNGKYIWFFGQDDFVNTENLFFCINLLMEYDPDIVFANYTINRTWNYNNKSIFNSNQNISCGIGVKNFLKISKKKLPSFLPSLIIKKEAWPTTKVISKFYGTHFIQLATFLYNLALNKKWLYIGKPLAVGEIPSTGWQNLLINRIKYYVGFISCLDIINKLELKNINILVNEQKTKSIIQHILLSLECKIEHRDDLILPLYNSTIFLKQSRLIAYFIYKTPLLFLIPIQTIRKIYYKIRNKWI